MYQKIKKKNLVRIKLNFMNLQLRLGFNIKKFLLVIFLYSTSVAFSQEKVKQIDNKFGFRDIRLEASFASISNTYSLKEQHSNIAKVKNYTMTGMNMYLDDMPIKFITLEFIDDELYNIFIRIECDKSVVKLTKLIEDSYGKITENKESRDYYIKGDKAELTYQLRGEKMSNGYLLGFALLNIRSLKLKKKITGTDNGF